MPTSTETERWAARAYEAMGYLVHRARNSTVKRGKIFVTQSNDIFNLFDLVCLTPVYGVTIYAQVTRSRGAASARRRKIIDALKEIGVTKEALENFEVNILIYDTQKNRTDPRKVDRFFYVETLCMVNGEFIWKKTTPLQAVKQ